MSKELFVLEVPVVYKNTPLDLLFQYHNKLKSFDNYDTAQVLVGMCMDNRKQLNIPENFAYILRTGGGNLRYNEFKVSYAISIGKVKYIALIAHNNCGMVNLMACKDEFINGLVKNAGWEKEAAENHFMHFSTMFEIGNEIDFVLSEVKRLRLRYRGITVAPFYFNIETSFLSFLKEE